MRTLFSNRYLDAFAKSIFLFGVIHIIILIMLAVRDGQRVLNIFTILVLHSFVPGLADGSASFILSYCAATAVYCSVSLHWTEGTNRND